MSHWKLAISTIVLVWAMPAAAQRIQFPTTISPPLTGAAYTNPGLLTPQTSAYQQPAATYPPSSTYSPPGSTYQPSGAYAPPYNATAQAYGQATGGYPAGSTYTQTPPTYSQPAPGYTQPTPGYTQPTPGYTQPTPGYTQPTPGYVQPTAPAYTSPGAYVPPSAPALLPPPGSTAGAGAAVPPPAGWDPYAAPCPSSTPSALLPQDPYFQYGQPAAPAMAMTKVIQNVKLDYHWFAGNGDHELGINDVELSVTAAVPFFFNAETPLLVTPGFAVHYWSGPISDPASPNPADLPPRTYDAYLDTAWNPQVLPWLGAELSFRIGAYSDFNKKVTTDTLRFLGNGFGVITLSPNFRIKAGVMYLDRNKIKLLPSGGIVWTPNPDVYFNILFPNPKIARRLINYGTTEWWIYAAGDYGGGAWQITRADLPFSPVANSYDNFDYNDIRVSVGLEFKTYRNFTGLFEVGGAFSRELIYRSQSPPAFYPNNTVFLRGGLAY